MKLVIQRKDPFDAAKRIDPATAKIWIPKLTLALCNAHRQGGNMAFAIKFKFPLGKSGVKGLLEWLKADVEHYAWAARLVSSLMHRYNEGRDKRQQHPMTFVATVYLCHQPPLLPDKIKRRFQSDKNPLVPVRLTRAPWLDYQPEGDV